MDGGRRRAVGHGRRSPPSGIGVTPGEPFLVRPTRPPPGHGRVDPRPRAHRHRRAPGHGGGAHPPPAASIAESLAPSRRSDRLSPSDAGISVRSSRRAASNIASSTDRLDHPRAGPFASKSPAGAASSDAGSAPALGYVLGASVDQQLRLTTRATRPPLAFTASIGVCLTPSNSPSRAATEHADIPFRSIRPASSRDRSGQGGRLSVHLGNPYDHRPGPRPHPDRAARRRRLTQRSGHELADRARRTGSPTFVDPADEALEGWTNCCSISGGHTLLERRFLQLMRTAGLPQPRTQVVHRRGGRERSPVSTSSSRSALRRRRGLGRKGHASDAERARDAQRRNELQDVGRKVYEYTYQQVTREPEYVIRTMRQRLGHAIR